MNHYVPTALGELVMRTLTKTYKYLDNETSYALFSIVKYQENQRTYH